MSRLQKLFANRKNPILSVYYTAGFPRLADTAAIAGHLQASGADVIEIGIPFSDPVADGPTIQQSNKTALDNGMTLSLLIEQVKEIRNTVTIPIILMGYLNPVMQYGVELFVKDASAAGVDGLILPDMPLPEYDKDYRKHLEQAGLTHSFLISPTTSDERIRQIDGISSSFIYAVSASSTTGAKDSFTEEQIAYFRRLKEMKLKNPFLIGFGIANHATFSQAAQFGAGAIVGSAFINLLRDSKNMADDIRTFVKGIKGN